MKYTEILLSFCILMILNHSTVRFYFFQKKDMWNMNGKELTKLQERQIEKLKEQWFAELDALSKKKRPLPKNVFSMDYNRERIKLAEKYLPLIKKIMSENEGNTDEIPKETSSN